MQTEDVFLLGSQLAGSARNFQWEPGQADVEQTGGLAQRAEPTALQSDLIGNQDRSIGDAPTASGRAYTAQLGYAQ